MPDLNQRPSGLESDALPTELISHRTNYCRGGRVKVYHPILFPRIFSDVFVEARQKSRIDRAKVRVHDARTPVQRLLHVPGLARDYSTCLYVPLSTTLLCRCTQVIANELNSRLGDERFWGFRIRLHTSCDCFQNAP